MASAVVLPLANIITDAPVATAISVLKTEMTAEQARKSVYQAPAAWADAAAGKVQFDLLLGKLVTAGLMAAS